MFIRLATDGMNNVLGITIEIVVYTSRENVWLFLLLLSLAVL